MMHGLCGSLVFVWKRMPNVEVNIWRLSYRILLWKKIVIHCKEEKIMMFLLLLEVVCLINVGLFLIIHIFLQSLIVIWILRFVPQFEYVYKCHNRIAMNISSSNDIDEVYEIKNFQCGRWISPPKALWRIYWFFFKWNVCTCYNFTSESWE